MVLQDLSNVKITYKMADGTICKPEDMPVVEDESVLRIIAALILGDLGGDK